MKTLYLFPNLLLYELLSTYYIYTFWKVGGAVAKECSAEAVDALSAFSIGGDVVDAVSREVLAKVEPHDIFIIDVDIIDIPGCTLREPFAVGNGIRLYEICLSCFCASAIEVALDVFPISAQGYIPVTACQYAVRRHDGHAWVSDSIVDVVRADGEVCGVVVYVVYQQAVHLLLGVCHGGIPFSVLETL